MDFKSAIKHYEFAGKNEFNTIFIAILLAERNMGTDYTDNILDHENSL